MHITVFPPVTARTFAMARVYGMPKIVQSESVLIPETSTTTLEPSLLPNVTEDGDYGDANFNMYYTPLLIFIGVLGNSASIYIFFNSKLKIYTTSQYLSALAISDTVFLILLLPPWLAAVQVTRLFYLNGFCQISVYMSYVACCTSSWLVLFFTFERFVAVMYPLHLQTICPMDRVKYTIGGIVLGAVLLNIPVLIFATPLKDSCNVDLDYLKSAALFNILDTTMSFTVPVLLIVLFNTCIMIGVLRVDRDRQQLCMDGTGGDNPTQPAVNGPRCQQRITIMLLIVSTVFVLLNVPAYVMRMIAYTHNMHSQNSDGGNTGCQQLSLALFNSNFAINFLLYCLSGQNFRRALMQVWQKLRGREPAPRVGIEPPPNTNIATTSFSNSTAITIIGEPVPPAKAPAKKQRSACNARFNNRHRQNLAAPNQEPIQEPARAHRPRDRPPQPKEVARKPKSPGPTIINMDMEAVEYKYCARTPYGTRYSRNCRSCIKAKNHEIEQRRAETRRGASHNTRQLIPGNDFTVHAPMITDVEQGNVHRSRREPEGECIEMRELAVRELVTRPQHCSCSPHYEEGPF